MSTKNQTEYMKKVQTLIGNRTPKTTGNGTTGFNQKIADLILSEMGTTVTECGKLLYSDYNPAFDTSSSKGKATRKSMRETRANLARAGNNVYKVKISGFEEITIACKPDEAKEKESIWRKEASEVKLLFNN